MIAIDKNIPIPKAYTSPGRPEGHAIYPWKTMEIGDSFIHPSSKETARAIASKRGKDLGKRFITRSIEGAVRIWRVA